jgi:hypothetical protein
MATPAPIVAVAPPEADPSALAVEPVAAAELNVNTPPALTVNPLPTTAACDVVLTTLIPIAAATDTFPPDVDADGVEADLSPPPPLAESVAAALDRSPCT